MSKLTMRRGLAVFFLVLLPGFAEVASAQTQPQGTGTAAQSGDLEAFKTRGDAARAANHLQEAASVYQEAVRVHPRWTEGHWYLGTISYELGNYRVCRTELEQVLKIQTKNGAGWAFKGLCEFQLKTYGTALDDLTRANELGVGEDSDFVAVVGYHRAMLLARAGQFERALNVCAGFVRGGNTNPEILDVLGVTILRLAMLPSEVPLDKREMVRLAGRAGAFSMSPTRDAAEQAFTQLVSAYGDNPNVHYVYGTYLSRDRPEEAMQQFKLELQRSPDHVPARIQIAQELITRGDFEGARPYAAEAARLAPRDFLARKVLGQVKLQTGDTAGAIVELEEARRLEPSSPSVRFHLSRAYQRAGRADDAKRERAEFTRLEAIQQKQRGAVAGADAEQPEGSPQPQ
jgi:tetratricopeptide (TPR) repeat protein